jgi:His/Glu/Gln/Arg/opine family amino acid ABC transporter permease subunit
MTAPLLDYTFEWGPTLDRWRELLLGGGVDLQVGVLGFLLAAMLGIVVSSMRLSGFRPFRLLAAVYVEVMRGIPLYVFLLWIFFGLATVADIRFSPFQAMVIALAFTGSGYTAEIFRGGFQAVAPGQGEAAKSLGLSALKTFRYVVFPQALRIAIPPLGNTLIGSVKGATIMSVIGEPDMVFVANDINAAYFTPFEAFAAVAVILIVMIFALSTLVALIERMLRLQ